VKKALLLVMIIVALASMILTGCGGGQPASEPTQAPTETEAPAETETEAPEETEEPEIVEYKQSPMLDGMDLPPVAERLPEEPKIYNEMPEDLMEYEIGRYGGTLRTVTSVINWDADVFVINNEPLVNSPGYLGKEFTGNIVQGYEASADQKEFIFYLRKGLKWSDGEPVTIEDYRFAFEDVIFNEELTPIFPQWLRGGGSPDGEPVKFEVIDDWSFKLTFDREYGGLPIRLAIQGWKGYTDILKPAHYLKQFHKKYNTDEADLEAKIEEAGFEPGEWVNLFNYKDITNWECTGKEAIGFPRLYPWLLVKAGETAYEYERNPYYHKVDKAGNQLPYIDRIQSTLVQDMEMVTMKTLAGEVDISRESAALVKMPLYKENEKNGIKAYLCNMHVTPTDVFLNLTHEDTNWRKVVQDVRFRQALNLALNKEEIIDTIYYGFAEPSIMQDNTYDLAKANELLDEMGLTKGSDGFRKGPDGKTFEIPFEVQAAAPDIVPLTELIVEHWKQLGLNVTMKTIDGGLWGTRNSANELKASVMWTHTPLWQNGDYGQGFWGPLWSRWWNTGGKEGEEPPEEVKHFYSLVDKIYQVPAEESPKVNEELRAEMGKHIWYFVHVENVKQPMITNEKLGNVSDKTYAIACNFAGEGWFFKE
jgi:peptide/nickel transport system substrate-binding protein